MGRKLLVLIPILIFASWLLLRSQPSPVESPSTTVKLVGAPEFRTLIANPDVFVLDVHTPEQTHLPGTDALIPDTEVASRLDELPGDKDTPIAVYCRSGNMSEDVAKLLVENGYTNVTDLEGGVNAYQMHVSEVSLTPATQDLGTVIYGDVATTILTLTNYTAQPLTITRLTTSCSCTTAELSDMIIDPYTAREIAISFDPAVHKDDTDLGDLTRTIYLETDNPNYSHLEASFTATVIKE